MKTLTERSNERYAIAFPYHFSILNEPKDICLNKLQSIFLNKEKDIICQIINKKDSLGRTLLDLAVNKGYTDLLVEFLKFGGDINCQGKDGNTLLHTAIYSKHPGIIDTLLKYNNLKINMQDNNGETPLHLACYLGKGENAYKLLEAGADYNIENIWGKKAPELIGAYCVPESDFKEFNSLLSQKEALTEKGAQDCELEKTPLEKLEQNPKSAILKEEYNGPTNLASATLSLNSGENLPLIGNNEFLSKPEDYDITASLYNSSYIE